MVHTTRVCILTTFRPTVITCPRRGDIRHRTWIQEAVAAEEAEEEEELVVAWSAVW